VTPCCFEFYKKKRNVAACSSNISLGPYVTWR